MRAALRRFAPLVIAAVAAAHARGGRVLAVGTTTLRALESAALGGRLEAGARETAIFITHDIEEAVFLGDRVVVMSSHPGRIKADIAIDLPRPRREAMRGEHRFGELTEQIWNLIRDEAYRAIGGDVVAEPSQTEETSA